MPRSVAPRLIDWIRDWIRSHAGFSFLVLSGIWVLFLYWKGLLNPFSSYDDQTIIVNNAGLATWHGINYYLHTNVSFVGDLRGSGESYYRPLFWISLAFDKLLWGSRAAGFHLTNLLLHWTNGFLLFSLLRKLRVSLAAAGCTACVWLALPINSEAVAWISARAYCLAAFFVLLSALFAVEFLETRRTSRLVFYGLSALCALLSHEAGILVLPLTVLVAYALEKLASRAAALLYVVSIAAGLLYFGLTHLVGHSTAHGHPGALLPFGIFFFKYLGWMALPVHMSIERSSNTPGNIQSIQAILAAILAWMGMLGIFAIAIVLRRKQPMVAAGLVWTSIALAPFCGLVVIYQGMAERFLYFASAGLALLAVALAFSIPRRARPIALSVVALWVMWSAWRLEGRLGDWADPVSLYQSSLEGSPRSTKLWYNLGAIFEERGDLRRAQQSYLSVLRLEPGYEPAIAGLGNVQLRLDDPKRAVDLYRRALAIKADDAGALTNYAASLVQLGDFENAEIEYRRAIAAAPAKDNAYCGLGVLLFQEGNSLGAAVQFMKAQRADPLDSAPDFDLGMVYQKLGRPDVAASFFKKVLDLKPGDPEATTALRRLDLQQ